MTNTTCKIKMNQCKDQTRSAEELDGREVGEEDGGEAEGRREDPIAVGLRLLGDQEPDEEELLGQGEAEERDVEEGDGEREVGVEEEVEEGAEEEEEEDEGDDGEVLVAVRQRGEQDVVRVEQQQDGRQHEHGGLGTAEVVQVDDDGQREAQRARRVAQPRLPLLLRQQQLLVALRAAHRRAHLHLLLLLALLLGVVVARRRAGGAGGEEEV